MIRKVRNRVKKFWASLALLSAEMLVLLVLFTAAFAVLIYLIRNVFVLKNTKLDDHAFSLLAPLVSETNNAIVKSITFLGTHTFLVPANLFLIFWFLAVKKHKWYSIKIPAVALSSLALMFGLKQLFGRERPGDPLLQEAAGLSFPSGHALFSVTFYGLLVYMIAKSKYANSVKYPLMVLLILLILAIGLTRIYLKVHYATDVIAGFSVGFLWLVFALAVLNYMERYSRKEIAPVLEQR